MIEIENKPQGLDTAAAENIQTQTDEQAQPDRPDTDNEKIAENAQKQSPDEPELPTAAIAASEEAPGAVSANGNAPEQPAENNTPDETKTAGESAENVPADAAAGEETPAEMIEIVGIRFKKSGKIYYFDPDGIACRQGGHAVVETARGVEYGTITIANRMVPISDIVLPLRKILRVATPEDEAHHAENIAAEKEAFNICLEKIHSHNMSMKLIDVEYTFDNNKLLFYFTADGRVDFRELVKDLASVFRTRIELRQIGIRDEAKLMGGLGVCGRTFCCHSFLPDFAQVSIKMAKEQNLSLNSAKISGACGRLMCCLRYENDVYEEEAKKLPKLDQVVQTSDGDGVVIEVNALAGKVRVRLFARQDVAPKYFTRDEIIKVKGFAHTQHEDDEDEELKNLEAEDAVPSDENDNGKPQGRNQRQMRDGRRQDGNHRRFERQERGDKPENAEKSERTDKPERVDRPERTDRPERADKPERVDKPERADRPERTDRPERADKPERVDRPERTERPERVDRPEHTDKPERTEQPERTDKPEQPDNADKSERPERSERRHDRRDRRRNESQFQPKSEQSKPDAEHDGEAAQAVMTNDDTSKTADEVSEQTDGGEEKSRRGHFRPRHHGHRPNHNRPPRQHNRQGKGGEGSGE